MILHHYGSAGGENGGLSVAGDYNDNDGDDDGDDDDNAPNFLFYSYFSCAHTVHHVTGYNSYSQW